MIIALRSLAIAAALSSPALAQTTWYVDPNATGPGTGSESDPYSSIQYGVEQATTQNNDIFRLAPGTYFENLDLLSAPGLTFEGTEGAGRTVIRPAGPGPVFWIENSIQTLRGVTITGVTDHDTPAVLVELGGCLKLENSAVVNNAGVGVQNDYDANIYRSTLAGNGVGYNSFQLSAGVIRESVLWGNGVGVASAGFIFTAWESNFQDALSFCGNCIQADPLYVNLDHGDVHLLGGSPCIGATTDGEDMGCFDFDPDYRSDLQQYCQGLDNSTGGGARLNSVTPPSLSAGDFRMDVASAVPNQFGLFYYGSEAAQVPFGDGLRCVGGGATGTFRFQPASLISATGEAQLAVDFGAAPANSGPGALVAGSTWFFQFWYRDPAGPGGAGFNFSNGLRVTFWP